MRRTRRETRPNSARAPLTPNPNLTATLVVRTPTPTLTLTLTLTLTPQAYEAGGEVAALLALGEVLHRQGKPQQAAAAFEP